MNNAKISQEALKKELISLFEQSPNYKDLIQDGKVISPTLDVFCDNISGFASTIVFQKYLLRGESYIDTANIDSSIFLIARTFGYNINRASAPILQFQYLDTPGKETPETLLLINGTTIGTYDGLDLVYFGPNKLIEKGDKIDFKIGHFFEASNQKFNFKEDDDLVSLQLVPQMLKAIDNKHIQLKIGDKDIAISKQLEDFNIYNKVADYSLDNKSTLLYVYDYNSLFGFKITPASTYNISYLETNGALKDFDLSLLQIEDIRFVFHSFVHSGYDGDTLTKIKKYTNFYYTTLRRAVTDDDYKYIIQTFPMIKTCMVYSKNPYQKYVFYIHELTEQSNQVILKESEISELATLMDPMKITRTELFFVVSKSVPLKIKLKIKLKYEAYLTEVKNMVLEHLRSRYSMKLGVTFNMGELLAEISKMEVLINNVYEPIVNYVFPMNGDINQQLNIWEYFIFEEDNLTIEIY